jgi:hypothetical protein
MAPGGVGVKEVLVISGARESRFAVLGDFHEGVFGFFVGTRATDLTQQLYFIPRSRIKKAGDD